MTRLSCPSKGKEILLEQLVALELQETISFSQRIERTIPAFLGFWVVGEQFEGFERYLRPSFHEWGVVVAYFSGLKPGSWFYSILSRVFFVFYHNEEVLLEFLLGNR